MYEVRNAGTSSPSVTVERASVTLSSSTRTTAVVHTHTYTHRVLARVHVYKYSLCDRCAAADWTTLRASKNYFGTFDIPFASFPEKK